MPRAVDTVVCTSRQFPARLAGCVGSFCSGQRGPQVFFVQPVSAEQVCLQALLKMTCYGHRHCVAAAGVSACSSCACCVVDSCYWCVLRRQAYRAPCWLPHRGQTRVCLLAYTTSGHSNTQRLLDKAHLRGLPALGLGKHWPAHTMCVCSCAVSLGGSDACNWQALSVGMAFVVLLLLHHFVARQYQTRVRGYISHAPGAATRRSSGGVLLQALHRDGG